jgi:hypothetical protein
MRIGKIRKKSSHGCRVRTTTESTRSYSAIISAPVCRFAGQSEQGSFAQEHEISMMTETIEASSSICPAVRCSSRSRGGSKNEPGARPARPPWNMPPGVGSKARDPDRSSCA